MTRDENSRFTVFIAGLLCVSHFAVGCSHFSNRQSPARLEQGYTIVLPGIEGASVFNANLALGLEQGGVNTAIEIDDWTTGNPLLMLVHLRNWDRNQIQARRLAAKIVSYQDRYPGRPVHLIGHSGGGGLALLTLEALPANRKISSAILLAPAVSPDFDLDNALSKTEHGIWNFHSPWDLPLLVVGTTILGTLDGRHVPAAGAYGFTLAGDNKVRQVDYDAKMLRTGHLGGHFGWMTPEFGSNYLAPLLRSYGDPPQPFVADKDQRIN